METAIRHFVRHGYDGARVDSIVRDLGVSKNLVYHYFGSKKGLYIAALEEIYVRFRGRGDAWNSVESSPVDGLRGLVSGIFRALAATPEITSMLSTENLLRGENLKQSAGIRAIYDPLFSHIEELVQDGKEKGLFLPELDPVHLYLTISGMAYHYFSNRYTLSVVLGRDIMTRKRLTAWQAHVEDVTLRACLRPEHVSTYL